VVRSDEVEMAGASGSGVAFHEFASSWYQVAWSHELAVGAVVPLRYFGRELVLYRGEDGTPVVLDAICPHLGAHLGHGGCVSGGDIVCPFHGWRWGGDGSNVEIPYARRPNKAARIGSYPVREVNGCVLMWFDHDDAEPTWEPPRFEEFYSADYFALSPHGTAHIWKNVGFAPQHVMENSADFAHFKFVHKNAEIAVIDYVRPDWPVFRYQMATTYRTPEEPSVPGELPGEMWGLGLLMFRVLGVHDTTQLVTVTPIDEAHSDLRISVVSRNTDGTEVPDGMALRIMRHQIKEIERDLPIWENMAYLNRPLLTPDEAKAFRILRAWTRQFYPGGERVELESIERDDPQPADSDLADARRE